MILMSLFFFLFLIEPIEVISLDKEFNSIEFYNDQIYLASFTGKSIFKLTESRNMIPISFTDDVNYRIYDFHVSPFAIYLNNGKSIEKFYFSSGIKENVYSSRDISSFIITSSEEIVLADREKRELIFLDFTNIVKFKKHDLSVKDLQIVDDLTYALTNIGILMYDEFGNLLEEIKIPEKFNRFYADSNNIILFSKNKKYIYQWRDDWIKIDLLYGISDIGSNEKTIIFLDDKGTNLYIHNKHQID